MTTKRYKDIKLHFETLDYSCQKDLNLFGMIYDEYEENTVNKLMIYDILQE